MPDSLETLHRKMIALQRVLTDDDAIAQAYAELVIVQARKRAAGHPTPQARMAATGIEARNGALYGAPGRIVFGRGGAVALGEIVWGAEMGSSIYRQFGARHSRGAWLYPAGEDDRTVDLFERGYIEDQIVGAIN